MPEITKSGGDSAHTRVLVVGIGNDMMRDDGVGVVAARALQQQALGEGVRVLELGMDAFDLVYEMQDVPRVIIIDAVSTGGEPGNIYEFTPDDARSVNSRTSSLHGIDLLDALELAKATKVSSQVIIIGVEPHEVAPGQNLSAVVDSRVSEVVEVVKRLIGDEAVWSGGHGGS